MKLRARILSWLRVPHEPVAPAGDRDVKVFRAARGYYLYRLATWFLKNFAAALSLALALSFSGTLERRLTGQLPDHVPLPFFDLTHGRLNALILLLEAGAVLTFVLQAIGSLALLRLDFEQRWYMVSDRSLRIREGLVRLHEKTMTFANVQNVAIRQGPLQRVLGIADLEVRTAGGGSGGEEAARANLHVAYFRGIANAAEVRDIIRERVRQFRDAGLGDADDLADPSVEQLAAAARRLALEAHALRSTLLLLRVPH